jgi:hypothetical protein
MTLTTTEAAVLGLLRNDETVPGRSPIAPLMTSRSAPDRRDDRGTLMRVSSP